MPRAGHISFYISPTPAMPRTLYFLFLFFVITAISLLIIHFSDHHFMILDSYAYLTTAENLLDGDGNIFEHGGVRRFNSIWPVGYPLLICAAHLLFQLPVFWASKVVNWLGIGVILLIFKKISSRNLLPLLLLNGTYIKVFSYSASEGIFITLLFVLALILVPLTKNKSVPVVTWAALTACCIALFTVRYIGLFAVAVVGLYALYFIWKKDYVRFFGAGIVITLTVAFATGYLLWNHAESGFYTGGTGRLQGIRLPAGIMIPHIIEALFNEFLLVKDLDIATYSWDFAVIGGLLLQVAVMVLVFFRWRVERRRGDASFDLLDPVFVNLLVVALVYFVLLMATWMTSVVDPLGPRFLSPFSILVWTAILYWLSADGNIRIYEKVRNYVAIVLILSVVNVMPGKFGMERLSVFIESRWK